MGRKAAPREDGVATGVHAAGDSGSGWPDDDQALFIAAGGGSIEEVLSLIRSGANVDYRDRASGMTPLMTVGTRIQAAVLLAAGADPNIADIQGRTPLHHVLFAREAEVIIPLLMASGAEIDVSAPQSGGETAFLEARQLFFEGRDPEAAERVIRLLAEYGADINAQDSQGDTVLMTAARRDRTGLVRWLLNLGADPGLRNIDGVSAIDIARQEGNEKLVQLLVSR
jgi:ankyrin repeat protein